MAQPGVAVAKDTFYCEIGKEKFDPKNQPHTLFINNTNRKKLPPHLRNRSHIFVCEQCYIAHI